MRFVVIIVSPLMILSLAAFGVVSAHKGATPTGRWPLCASLRRR